MHDPEWLTLKHSFIGALTCDHYKFVHSKTYYTEPPPQPPPPPKKKKPNNNAKQKQPKNKKQKKDTVTVTESGWGYSAEM